MEFISYPSKTYRKRTPCGNLYIIVDFKDGHIHKIRYARSSNLKCSLKGLFRSITYQTRRDIKQSIKDLKGSKWDETCEGYSMLCEAVSCADAVGQVLEKVLKDEKEKK